MARQDISRTPYWSTKYSSSLLLQGNPAQTGVCSLDSDNVRTRMKRRDCVVLTGQDPRLLLTNTEALGAGLSQLDLKHSQKDLSNSSKVYNRLLVT